jgi:prevent-host-death family protein
MSKTVAVSELKTHCLRLIDEVARRRRSIVVTKRGRPVARVVPIDTPGPDDALLRLRGTLIGGEQVADFDSPLRWKAATR